MKPISLFCTFLFCLALKVEAQGHWVVQNSGTTSSLSSVQFIDANTGWTVGSGNYHGIILKTINGGNTWTVLQNGYRFQDFMLSVCFLNATTGWVLGWYIERPTSDTRAYDLLGSTTDGGITWNWKGFTGFNSNITSGRNSIYFVTPNKGWTVGLTGGYIALTTDGGASWAHQIIGTQLLYSVHSLDGNIGWTVGNGGTIFRTTNGGTNWSSCTSGTSRNLRSVYFASAARGWAVGFDGVILSSTDSGKTWNAQTSGTIRSLQSVHFVNPNTGWAVGDSGTILKTSNGGSSWSSEASGSNNGLLSVSFVNASNGWAVGGGGTLLKYTTGTPILAQSSAKVNFSIKPSGKISYRLPQQSHVSATIIDANGKVVLKLFDGDRQAGNHDLRVPEKYSSESFFLDFKTDDFQKTVRMR